MARPDFIKDPQAILDYGFDWSNWLADDETITASEWTVPTGLTEVDSTFTTTRTSVWLSSGTVDTEYEVKNHITTSDSREDDRTLKIRVVQR